MMENFDQIAQELFKQKQRMKALEAENLELRRQLAALRVGRGILVSVNGVSVALDLQRRKSA